MISPQKFPLVYAHRGASLEAVENTEPAIALALQLGADVIETDVHLSADGHPVLSHDADFYRLAGDNRPLSGLSRQEISSIELGRGSKPLFLDEAVEIFPQTLFNIDLKVPDPRLAEAYVQVLRQAGAMDRVVTASFEEKSLRLFRQICPEGRISTSRSRVFSLVMQGIAGFFPSPREGEVSLQLPETIGAFRLLTPRRIRKWQKAGWRVHVWTIDEEKDMRRFAAWGVDGIMTNDPRKLCGLRETFLAQGEL